MHTVYRNLAHKDKVLGLSLSDVFLILVIFIFLSKLPIFQKGSMKLVLIGVVGILYLVVWSVRRQFPENYFKNMVSYLFNQKIYLAESDYEK